MVALGTAVVLRLPVLLWFILLLVLNISTPGLSEFCSCGFAVEGASFVLDAFAMFSFFGFVSVPDPRALDGRVVSNARAGRALGCFLVTLLESEAPARVVSRDCFCRSVESLLGNRSIFRTRVANRNNTFASDWALAAGREC